VWILDTQIVLDLKKNTMPDMMQDGINLCIGG